MLLAAKTAHCDIVKMLAWLSVVSLVVNRASTFPALPGEEKWHDLLEKGCNFPPKQVIEEANAACALLTSVYVKDEPPWKFLRSVCRTIVDVSESLCTTKKDVHFDLFQSNSQDVCNVTDTNDMTSDLQFAADDIVTCVNTCPASENDTTGMAKLCTLLLGLVRAKKTLPPSDDFIWQERFEDFQKSIEERNCSFPPKTLIRTDIAVTCSKPPGSQHLELQDNLCKTLFTLSLQGCELQELSVSSLAGLNDIINRDSIDVCKTAAELTTVHFLTNYTALEFLAQDLVTCPYVCDYRKDSARVCRLLLFAVTQPLLSRLQNLQTTTADRNDEESTTIVKPSTTTEKPFITNEKPSTSTTTEKLRTITEKPATTTEKLSTTNEKPATIPEKLPTIPEKLPTIPEKLPTIPEKLLITTEVRTSPSASSPEILTNKSVVQDYDTTSHPSSAASAEKETPATAGTSLSGESQASPGLDSSSTSMSSARILVYLVAVLCAVVLLYVLYINRNKLIDCVLASRESRQRRPSSSEAQYSKLQPSVEEVMPSLRKAASPKIHAY
ncbi:hypothetical protein BaRGS_00001572 [Batillaria attramentaria]|uniref:Uncharacterized protein n=1 Tax=Batillaria attramentaria TaxID=370345 RepID=A0ABD0M7Y9_9CAEN